MGVLTQAVLITFTSVQQFIYSVYLCSGFRSSFDRGCLSLWFNFRRNVRKSDHRWSISAHHSLSSSIVNKITWSLEMQINGVLSLISVECKITVLLCVSRGQQVFKLVKRSDALRLCYHFLPEPTRPNNGLFWQFCPSLSVTLRILALPNII